MFIVTLVSLNWVTVMESQDFNEQKRWNSDFQNKQMLFSWSQFWKVFTVRSLVDINSGAYISMSSMICVIQYEKQ